MCIYSMQETLLTGSYRHTIKIHTKLPIVLHYIMQVILQTSYFPFIMLLWIKSFTIIVLGIIFPDLLHIINQFCDKDPLYDKKTIAVNQNLLTYEHL